MYKKLKDTETSYYDVDDTLVLWVTNPTEDQMKDVVLVEDSFGSVPVIPHKGHIWQLMEDASLGKVVVVWSQGGSDWAEAVVKTLNLEHHVDVILTKPTKYYDDLPVTAWFPPRTFLENK